MSTLEGGSNDIKCSNNDTNRGFVFHTTFTVMTIQLNMKSKGSWFRKIMNMRNLSYLEHYL